MNVVKRNIYEIARLCYSRKVKGQKDEQGKTVARAYPCTAWKLQALMAEPEVERRCDILKRLNKGNWCSQEELSEIMQIPLVKKSIRKKELAEHLPEGSIKEHKDVFDAVKTELPIICWLSYQFDDDNHRVKDCAHENGLYIADYDGIDDPKKLIQEQSWDQPEFFEEHKIVYMGITPSAHGIRIVAERGEGMSLLDANLQLAEQLKISDLGIDNDTSVCEASRASYLVPTDYAIYVNWDKLGYASQAEADAVAQKCAAIKENGNNVHTPTVSTSENKNESAEIVIEDNYEGAKYTDIVAYILEQWGGEAKVNNRHDTLIRLAGNMRNICKDNPAQLAAALPKWKSDYEIEKMCEWVCAKKNNESIPQAVMAAVELAKAKRKIVEENSEEYKIDTDPNSVPLPEHLPRIYQIIGTHTPPQFMRQVILGTLPMLGACGTDIRFFQNSDEHAFSFMCLVIGQQASGKGNLRTPIELILSPLLEQDKIAVEKDNQYIDDKESLKNSEKQPKNEHVSIRKVPVNISERELVDNLYDSGGKALVAYDCEVDTLVTAGKKQWNVQKEIYKKSFDLESHGTCCKNSRKVQVNVFFNWTASCTPYALPRFIDQNDKQGGLATRLIITEMPEEWGQKQPKKTPYTDKEKQEVIAIARQLCSESGFRYLEPLEEWLDQWWDDKIEMYHQTGLRAVDILRKRSGIIGYRAGMLVADMFGVAQHEPGVSLTEEQKVLAGYAVEWAQFVAESDFRAKMKYFADDIEKYAKYDTPSSASVRYAQARQVQRLYASLPHQFTEQDIIAKRVENGESTVIKTITSRWRKDGLVTQNGKIYTKTCV